MNASACINFSFVLSEMIITLGSVRRPIDFEKIIFDRSNLITHSALQSNFTPGLNFINVVCTDFRHVDPECTKKTVKSAVSFGASETYEHKSCTENVGEIDTRFKTEGKCLINLTNKELLCKNKLTFKGTSMS